ncbi:hypothetical protein [Fulvimarina sp. MAC3]|uniref:hypothetical protein n=1 Tax=Fulvimarina sp. MAC3 TaxID=3148887 RepID=UPI0031FDD197
MKTTNPSFAMSESEDSLLRNLNENGGQVSWLNPTSTLLVGKRLAAWADCGGMLEITSMGRLVAQMREEAADRPRRAHVMKDI